MLCHCVAGISRSSTLTLAWLMFDQKMTLRDAYAYVKAKRGTKKKIKKKKNPSSLLFFFFIYILLYYVMVYYVISLTHLFIYLFFYG